MNTTNEPRFFSLTVWVRGEAAPRQVNIKAENVEVARWIVRRCFAWVTILD